MNSRRFLLLCCFWSFSLAVFGQISADFNAYPRTNCNPPYEVTFQNLSQGDTAWHWDFGDGNTSFFPDPIHLYASVDTYTVSLITYGPTGSDTIVKEDFIITLPPQPTPILNKTADTLTCGDPAVYIATGLPDLVWYDEDDDEVARGDSLVLPFVLKNTHYKVRSVEEGVPQRVGKDTFLNGGDSRYVSGPDKEGLRFDVFQHVILKSVLVKAITGGVREFELQDRYGVILKTIRLGIPAGISRIQLNMELVPGNYQLVGAFTGLWTDADYTSTFPGFPYPYEIPDILSIVGSTTNHLSYFYFFDWEVVPFCGSSFSQVDIVVNKIDLPGLVADTVVTNCGVGTEIMSNPHPVYDTEWWGSDGFLLGIKDTLQLPYIDSSEMIYGQHIFETGSTHFGPEDPDSLGPNRYFNVVGNNYLSFVVYQTIHLKSVLVKSAAATTLEVILNNRSENSIEIIETPIPAGKSRIQIDRILYPGIYTLGNINDNLFRNYNSALEYPYMIKDVVSITGSSGNAGQYNQYNYYYDWEISPFCKSEWDSTYVQVNQPLPPILNKLSDTLLCGDSTSFTALSGDSLYWYDSDGRLVHQGKKLYLPSVSQPASYEVREEAHRVMRVGPPSPDSVLLPSGMANSFYADGGISFQVHEPVIIRSVTVFSYFDDIREIFVKDVQGNIIKTYKKFIKSGEDCIHLDLKLSKGRYSISGPVLELLSSFGGAQYPYSIDGLIELTGPHTGYNFDNYYCFYDWEVVSACYSPFVQVDLDVIPRPKPVITSDTVSASCGGEVQSSASSNGEVYWYNTNGYEMGRGDTLRVPFAAASTRYYAVDQSFTHQQQIGPEDPDSLGMKMYLDTMYERGLSFTVYSDITLHSVLVDADSSGLRHIVVRSANGSIYQAFDVFLSAGKSRIPLDIDFSPGKYFIGGRMLGLALNTVDSCTLPFPYLLVGVVSIDASEGEHYRGRDPRSDFYHYFYDWEIEIDCASERDSIFLQVNPVGSKPPVFPPAASLYCPDSLSFYSSGDSVIWFDQQGNFISDRDTLTKNRISDSTTFFCQTVNESPALYGGLRYFPTKSGGIHDTSIATYMLFEVREEISLLSVFGNADSSGMRRIFLNDSSGVPIDTFDLLIQAGPQRIPLNIELGPGRYQLGGANMGLSYQDQEVQYPVDVAGLLSVKGSTADTAWYFFFDWEIKKSCISDYTTVPVNFADVPSPVAASDTVNIACNAKDTLWASSMDHTLWFDELGALAGKGDSLPISLLKDSTTYFAVNKTDERFYLGGLTSRTASGDFSLSQEGLVFDVYEDVILRSVKVYAQSPGNRSFVYLDSLGNILDSTTVFIPQGESRVSLNFTLQVGQDFELAVNGNADLYRDTANVSYPYPIYSYVNILQSSSSRPMAYYSYFYDWEVGDPACQSVGTPVVVQVAPFRFTSGITGDDTLCYEMQNTFSSAPTIGKWLDSTDNLLQIGSGLTTPILTKNISYTFIPETPEPTQQSSPFAPSLVGPFQERNDSVLVYFTVESPLRLNSVWVGTTVAGSREVVLQDSMGNVLQRSHPWLPSGTGRMLLGWELQPGDYAVVGDSLGLYANDQGAAYPYRIPDKLSITGNSIDPTHFYYFYNWEIQDIPCKDDTVIYEIAVLPEIVPLFSYTQVGSSLAFSNLSSPGQAFWHWDFGDGDTSVLAAPTHTYLDTGYFVVTLRVNNGFCEESYTDSVYFSGPIDGIEDLFFGSFSLFPNPGNGRFTIEAQAEGLREMKMEVYDLQGRVLYQSAPQRTAHFREEVDLSQHPVGTFVVQFWIDSSYIVRKYVKY